MQEEVAALCPYCGEEIHLLVDLSIDEQSYVEDCSVCCRPIVVSVTAEDGELVDVSLEAENE